MRALSPRAVLSTTIESTEEVWLVLLTIAHPSLDEPIRVVNDFSDITSADPETGAPRTFIACPFQIILPDEDATTQVMAQLKIDNVDRSMVGAIRELDSYATISIEVVLASQPDIIEVSFYDMQMRSATYDALYITGNMTFEQIFTEPIALDQTPARFPGMF